MSILDEEFDVLGEDDLALLSRVFECMYMNCTARLRGGAWACATSAGSMSTSSLSVLRCHGEEELELSVR
jgi:hypothetical protein